MDRRISVWMVFGFSTKFVLLIIRFLIRPNPKVLQRKFSKVLLHFEDIPFHRTQYKALNGNFLNMTSNKTQGDTPRNVLLPIVLQNTRKLGLAWKKLWHTSLCCRLRGRFRYLISIADDFHIARSQLKSLTYWPSYASCDTYSFRGSPGNEELSVVSGGGLSRDFPLF